MIYGYTCKDHGEFDIVKSHTKSDTEERCPECNKKMKKGIYAPGGLTFGTFKEGYYHAFGKKFRTKHELKNELSRIKGETGKEYVEVGNDKSVDKKKRIRFNKDQKLEMARELKKELNDRAR